MTRVAFITGVNGISGNAILQYLVENTTAQEWSQIVVSSRSPLATKIQDSRVKFIALDYSADVVSIVQSIRSVCEHVTHAFYCSYVHKDDFGELNEANTKLFEHFLDSLEQVAQQLENITLQTGGKYYQVHLMPVPSPAREEEPRREGPIPNFYFRQEDKLTAAQKGKQWSWNVIRPEAIIGTTPKPNGMNEALTIAMYFLVCRELDIDATMPTNQRYWEGTEDGSYAPLIADLTVYVSTHPHCANQAFNMTNGDHFSWRYMWPRLAAYFGARASQDQHFVKAPPKEGELQQELRLLEWSKDKRPVWNQLCLRHNFPQAVKAFDYGTWAFQDWVFQRSWSATLNISKARRYGWNGYIDSYQSFINTFEHLKDQGLLPPS